MGNHLKICDMYVFSKITWRSIARRLYESRAFIKCGYKVLRGSSNNKIAENPVNEDAISADPDF